MKCLHVNIYQTLNCFSTQKLRISNASRIVLRQEGAGKLNLSLFPLCSLNCLPPFQFLKVNIHSSRAEKFCLKIQRNLKLIFSFIIGTISGVSSFIQRKQQMVLRMSRIFFIITSSLCIKGLTNSEKV